jgi:tartrate dehydratase alpha subunit/fumarate hydratase class I-like protein
LRELNRRELHKGLMGVGGAAAVADIALWVLAARKAKAPVALVVPTGTGLAAVGAF